MQKDVKHYSREIALAAVRKVNGRTVSNEIEFYSYVFTVGATSPSIYFFVGCPLYHISGFLSGLVGRVIDTYATYKCVKEIDDLRFKEYGLGKFYFEGNPFMIEHPTKKEYLSKKKLLKEVIGSFIWSFFLLLVMVG